MKQFLLLLSIFLLVASGCSNAKSTVDVNNGLKLGMYHSALGSTDGTFNQQKLTYDITISNKNNVKLRENSFNLVYSAWVKQNKVDSKITDKTINDKNIEIKGYVVFNTKGMTKKEIAAKEPFIKGINVVTAKGSKLFLKKS